MNVSAETIARTVVLALALINQILAIAGREVLPFGEDAVYQLVTLLATLGASLAAWWKNNSFTSAARAADVYMKKLKEKRDENLH